MRINKSLLILLGVVFVMFATTAYASSSNFLTQAQKYIDQHCSRKYPTNQTALLCYLFNKSQEHDASIASLSATLLPIPGQITNLQNTTGKTLKVFDANNQELGLLVGAAPNPVVIYNIRSGEMVQIEGNGTIGVVTLGLYTTSDCTGTVYTDNNMVNDFLLAVRGKLFQVDTTKPLQTLTINSQGDIASSPCEQVNRQLTNLRTLTPANNPFPNPVTLPLQFKYQ